ncbi:MAG TPA: hypothetical protein VNK82_10870 [Terriglobales bacterium]|nr:hypothetical protein [Terriglobales bacterium]
MKRKRFAWGVVAATWLLVVLLASPAVAQTAAPPASTNAPVSAAAPAAAPSKDARLSPEQAEQLLKSVDEVMALVSEQTGLPVRHPVKRALASREQVREHIRGRMAEDQDAERLLRSEVVLKKFGLLPREFDLGGFLLDLLEEQVAGFYDMKTQTVYLLDWVEPAVQKPVLAHELTHALQDQMVPLEKWVQGSRPPKPGLVNPDDLDAEADEESVARSAVVEGQGMVSLIEYAMDAARKWMAANNNQGDPFSAPEIAGLLNSNAPTAVLEQAPMFLRESLAFPYTWGLRFTQEVDTRAGRERAFAGVLRDPPKNSYQVMNPQSYLKGETFAPLRVPKLRELIAPTYEPYDSGSVGAIDVALLLREYGQEADEAEALARQWRAGLYYAARKKDGPCQPPASKSGVILKAVTCVPTTPAVAMVYVSRWASAAAADRFAGFYGAGVEERYQRAAPVLSGVKKKGAVEEASRPTEWLTEEGPVWIEKHGDLVVVMEGFDERTAARLRRALLAALLPTIPPATRKPAGSSVRH